MPRSVRPFLMTQGNGSAALDFYSTVFPEAIVEDLELHAGGQFPAGTLKTARITIAGQIILLNELL
jgi:uncharacterized glyoxalase superfamily protein PhnB